MTTIPATTLPDSLDFEGTTIEITDHDGTTWVRANQIGLALSYKNPELSISKLFRANKDEFTADMTALVDMPTASGVQKVRIFSPRGCHLIAMFARTAKAKAFRRWVLDVLDKAAVPAITHQPAPALPPPSDRSANLGDRVDTVIRAMADLVEFTRGTMADNARLRRETEQFAAIKATGGGTSTEEAYRFCIARTGRKVWGIKGASSVGGARGPIWPPIQKISRSKGRYRPVIVNVNTAKDTIRARLLRRDPGAGYVHFPANIDVGYFEQLISERSVQKRVNGLLRPIWEPSAGRANEASDCAVYAYAALCGLIHGGFALNAWADAIGAVPSREMKLVDGLVREIVRADSQGRCSDLCRVRAGRL